MKIRGLPSLATQNICTSGSFSFSVGGVVSAMRGIVYLYKGPVPQSMEDIPFQIDGGPNDFSFDGIYGAVENCVGSIPVNLSIATTTIPNDTVEFGQSSSFNHIVADKILTGLSGLLISETGSYTANTTLPDFKSYALKNILYIPYTSNSTYNNTKKIYTISGTNPSAGVLPNSIFRNVVPSSGLVQIGYSRDGGATQQWTHVALDKEETVDCFVVTHGSDSIGSVQRLYIDYWNDNTNTWVRTNVNNFAFYNRAEATGNDGERRTFIKLNPVTAKMFRLIVSENYGTAQFHFLKQIAFGSTTDLSPVAADTDPVTWALLAPGLSNWNFNTETYADRSIQWPLFLLTVGDAAATGVNLNLDKLVFDHSVDYDFPTLLSGSLVVGQ